ncbi:YhdP family protein [Thiocystis violacea]|uniref:YhdP family protein n=1 Tax=Thiocystis violacea TaxID=13725 RepID=UPI001906CA27|nr:YhdP family protein [Thiocystis violacea]
MPFLNRLAAYSLRLALLILVSAALLVSVLRFVQPLANGFRGELAQILSQRLGYQVSIGALRLGSTGFEPRITLERVRLSKPDDGEVALSLSAMELDLNLPASIWTRAPQFDAFTLIGARLVIERFADGHLRIVGLGALRSDDPRALDLFLGQGRLNLADSEVLYVDHNLGGKVARLVGIRLALENAGDRHRMELTARLVPPDPIVSQAPDPDPDPDPVPDERRVDEGNHIKLVASLDGPPSDPSSWSGGLYVKLDARNLGLLVPAARLKEVQLDTRGVALETWLRIERGGLLQSIARVALDDVALTPPRSEGDGVVADGARARQRFERLRALVRARHLAAGWQVQVAGLDVSLNAVQVAGLDLDLRLSHAWRLAGLGLTAARLDLADLARLSQTSPWPVPGQVDALIEHHPRGQVSDLALGVAPPAATDGDAGWRWTLSARFEALGLDQKARLPGFEGLNGVLSADQDGGELRLASERMSLDLNPLFTLPIALSQLSGQLDWQRAAAGGWHLSAHDIALENADLAGRAQLSLDLPADGASPFMDLRANFHDADAAQTRTYLPAGAMAPELLAWLEESIVAGRVTQGDVIFRGALADYPFRKNQGRFELLIGFEDLRLAYQKGWPPLESASGSLRFFNQGLTIRVDRGRIYDSAFSDGLAQLPDLWVPRSLRIHGEARGPFSDGLRTLIETPLAKDLGHLAQILTVSGESRLALDIDLPFQKDAALGVSGRLSWPAPATLGLAGTPVELSALDGSLGFTEKSLEAKAIRAQLWGRPLTLSIATEGIGDPDTSITRIEARAQTPVTALAERFPTDAWRFVKGKVDWALAVTLHNRDVNQQTMPLDFQLSSPLRGVALTLPAPLGKPAAAARDLEIRGTLVPAQSLAVTGHLGDLGANLRFALSPQAKRLLGGRIRLGDRAAPEPDAGALVLEGQLAELDLGPWITWLDAVGKDLDSGADSVSDTTFGLDLHVDRLKLGGMELTNAALDAGPLREGWQVRVRATELAGRVSVAPKAQARPLGIDLDRLDLKALGGRPEAKAPKKTDADDMAKIPSLDLRAKALSWGDLRLGTLELSVRQDASGMRIPRVALAGPGLVTLQGEGAWTRGVGGGRSHVELRLGAPDLGRLITALDKKTALEAKDASAKVDLSWPGSLSEAGLLRSNGSIDLKVGAGRFLAVEPGVGRVLGFLNFSALGRRLALDFSDLYGQGFAFEGVSGRLSLGQGKARFDDFLIDGTAGKVMVTGSTDLATERFDQTVTVEPKLGSSVALASAVAGGPVIGAAVYLVDRVAGNPIDRLGRYQYKVTGPWGDPEMTRIGWDPLASQPKSPAAADRAREARKPTNHFLDLE